MKQEYWIIREKDGKFSTTIHNGTTTTQIVRNTVEELRKAVEEVRE